jgi:glyoxalase family protein
LLAHSTQLLLDDAAKTGAVLTNALGLQEMGREGSVLRSRAPSSPGGVVDIYEAKGFLPGRQGRGSVHHIAFRAKDDAEQAEMARKLVTLHGLHPTGQRDRIFFGRSIFVSLEACCLRSRRMNLVLLSTSPWVHSGAR